MEPIAYKQVPIPGYPKSDVREGYDDLGCRWWLTDREHDVAYGSLTLGDPDRSKFNEYMARLKKPMEDSEFFSPEQRHLTAHVTPQSEIIYCSRMEMLIALIERLRDPRPAAGTMIEVLEAAGFVKDDNHDLYKLDIGKGVIYAWTERGGLKAEYHGSAPWWLNMLNINTSITTVKGEVWPMFWPESYGDVEAKTAEFLVEHYIPWVRSSRITRGTR